MKGMLTMKTIRIKAFNDDNTEIIFKKLDALPMVTMDPYEIARSYDVNLRPACRMKNDAMLAIYGKEKLKTRLRNFGSAGTRGIYELR